MVNIKCTIVVKIYTSIDKYRYHEYRYIPISKALPICYKLIYIGAKIISGIEAILQIGYELN